MRRLQSNQLDEWCLWLGFLLAVAGVVVPVWVPLGGTNRIVGVAVPFAVGAVALGINALTRPRSIWVATLLYAAASLAILYGVILALSVPLRLLVEGVCQPAPAPCPVGFDHPLTSAESFGVYAVGILGALSVLFTFIAAEVQYRRRRQLPTTTVSISPSKDLSPPQSGS